MTRPRLNALPEVVSSLPVSVGGRVVSCDKSNVMESYKLWRAVVTEVAADYPDVAFENMFADNCAFQLMARPGYFDVVLCCNQLGDLFSDLTGVLSGSLGMLPRAVLWEIRASGAVSASMSQPAVQPGYRRSRDR